MNRYVQQSNQEPNKTNIRISYRGKKTKKFNDVSLLYFRRLLYSADKCQLMVVNVGTVDSPALGGGYGVGRWPAHAR